MVSQAQQPKQALDIQALPLLLSFPDLHPQDILHRGSGKNDIPLDPGHQVELQFLRPENHLRDIQEGIPFEEVTIK